MDERQTARETLERALAAKLAQRRKLALLPFEKKIRMVLRMQQNTRQFKAAKPQR